MNRNIERTNGGGQREEEEGERRLVRVGEQDERGICWDMVEEEPMLGGTCWKPSEAYLSKGVGRVRRSCVQEGMKDEWLGRE